MQSILLLVIGVTCLPAFTQAQVRIAEADPLREISVRHLVSLGDEDGPGIVAEPTGVGRRRNGDWVVTDQANPAEVRFFSPEGEWIRTIGRRGEGPGEFKMATQVHILPGDSLWVYDFMAHRITFYTPDLKVSHTNLLDIGPTRLVDLGDGTLLASAQVLTHESVGLPLHLLSETGKRVSSFGATPPIQRASNQFLTFRSLTASGDGSAWSAHLTKYVLEEWAPDGERITHLERVVSWFPPSEHYGHDPRMEEPPSPGIIDIHRDSKGLIWVAIRVPDADWKKGYSLDEDQYGRPRMKVTDYNRLYDTRLEAIDPDAGTVLASFLFDEAVRMFTGSGEMVTYRLGDDLVPTIRIWEVRLPNVDGGER